MSTKKSFLKNFWQEKKMVGAMSPSSKFLAQKMLKNVDFKKAKVIVELGPGTGVFTKKILEKMNPDAKLLVFELNTDFYNLLKSEIQDDRMILIHDSAEKITEYLHKEDLLHADYVISSLPLANFPIKLQETILKESFDILKNQGKYIQFQYSLMSKKHLDKQFQAVHVSFTPINFPPAFVYTCVKEK
ncbi:MAG: class I SAM-dependent methyltransferase [Flavobacteriia bacterium]|jgi:phosphatidylethanolamine/phosphatidyl-N-methylethanolamine N-methyltransferase